MPQLKSMPVWFPISQAALVLITWVLAGTVSYAFANPDRVSESVLLLCGFAAALPLWSAYPSTKLQIQTAHKPNQDWPLKIKVGLALLPAGDGSRGGLGGGRQGGGGRLGLVADVVLGHLPRDVQSMDH